MNELFCKYLKLLKKPKTVLIIGLVGIGLILLSSFISSGESKKESVKTGEMTAEEYKAILEEDIKETVTDITGSKNVSVVITLESGIKYSYADIKEETLTEKKENEKESTGNETKSGYITVKTAEGGEQALLVTTQMPKVRGVAIVCDGGDNERIAEKIQNAVMSALDISSKKVYICGRNT